MTDEITLTLNNPLTDEQWDAITDVDFDKTERITFETKHGKHVEFAKVIRCKDCKHWNEYYRECDSPNWDTGTDDCFVVPAGFYCGWAERKKE